MSFCTTTIRLGLLAASVATAFAAQAAEPALLAHVVGADRRSERVGAAETAEILSTHTAIGVHAADRIRHVAAGERITRACGHAAA